MPLTAQDQLEKHQAWDYMPGTRDSMANSWGGQVISLDWLKSDESPNGFNLASLEGDLAALSA